MRKFVLVTALACLGVASVTCSKWITSDRLEHPQDSSKSSHDELLAGLAKLPTDDVIFHLYMEFFTLSVGDNFYGFDDDSAKKSQHQVVAASVSQMWQNLATMVKINEIIYEAIAGATKTVKDGGDIRNSMDTVTEILERQLRQNQTIFEEYQKVKMSAMAQPGKSESKTYFPAVPKSEAEVKEIILRWLQDLQLRKIIANGAFLNQTAPTTAMDGASFILARKAIELSKKPEIVNTVQRLYAEAVSETAADLTANADTLNLEHFEKPLYAAAAPILMKKLDEKFQNDPVARGSLETLQMQINF